MRVLYEIMSIMGSFLVHFTSCDHHHLVIYDLSHELYQGMPSEETSTPLEVSMVKQDHGDGARSEYYDFCMGEKQGTHINAPSTYHHYRNGSLTVDKLPVSYLVHVPAVVINNPLNRQPPSLEPSLPSRIHILTKHDIVRWEEVHGRIAKGAFVILRTGWSKYWLHPDKFFGRFVDRARQTYPGFGMDAITWLTNSRSISGVGTECVDVELPSTTGNSVKQFLASRNRFSIVQMTNLDELPPNNFHVTVAPLKLRGGSGGPARVFATVAKSHTGGGRRHTQYRHSTTLHRNQINPMKPQITSASTKPKKQPLMSVALIASIFLPFISIHKHLQVVD